MLSYDLRQEVSQIARVVMYEVVLRSGWGNVCRAHTHRKWNGQVSWFVLEHGGGGRV